MSWIRGGRDIRAAMLSARMSTISPSLRIGVEHGPGDGSLDLARHRLEQDRGLTLAPQSAWAVRLERDALAASVSRRSPLQRWKAPRRPGRAGGWLLCVFHTFQVSAGDDDPGLL